ncbi:hypothetical protein IC229_14345 [Spirosoma sp. BT702]|uniref:Lipocalin-like domain-containing protein n=1 Tax=Spirosoma profusum TaxID=2771354 RepID=A0A926XW70_9BACT|nr:hypothetical protein [Spirosoma profusum]MBD2701828.1 hypothetical protein [Spirosoma profusum]
MKIKTLRILLVAIVGLAGCQTKQTNVPIIGTWELVSATTIEGDTTFSTFDASHKMIKIINETHFAFLNHKIRPEKDTTSANEFTGGGGTYSLVDSNYTENLDYFVDKAWENHRFQFVVSFDGDTLVQKGVEKVEKLAIDRIIIEKYIRVKK